MWMRRRIRWFLSASRGRRRTDQSTRSSNSFAASPSSCKGGGEGETGRVRIKGQKRAYEHEGSIRSDKRHKHTHTQWRSSMHVPGFHEEEEDGVNEHVYCGGSSGEEGQPRPAVVLRVQKEVHSHDCDAARTSWSARITTQSTTTH